MNNVYKILREYEWEAAKESGQITTALDKQDGFIPVSYTHLTLPTKA